MSKASSSSDEVCAATIAGALPSEAEATAGPVAVPTSTLVEAVTGAAASLVFACARSADTASEEDV